MKDSSSTLSELKDALARFNAERAWGRFHTPQQLAMALSVESGELLDLFLWRAEADPPAREALSDEMADVLICLVNLANRVDIDLLAATEAKIAKNAAKYPIAKSFGRADRWREIAAASAGADGQTDGSPRGGDGGPAGHVVDTAEGPTR